MCIEGEISNHFTVILGLNHFYCLQNLIYFIFDVQINFWSESTLQCDLKMYKSAKFYDQNQNLSQSF